MTITRVHANVLAAMAVFWCFAVVFTTVSASYNAPDERMHHAYVTAVAQGRLPVLSAAKLDQEAYHPPLYYAVLAPVELVAQHLSERWHVLALRWATVLLASTVIPLSWWLGRLLFPDRPFVAGLMPWIVALQPQFAYMSGVINNDTLATVLATLGLCLLGRAVLQPPKTASTVITVLVVLGMFFTKASIWPLAVIVLLTAALTAPRRLLPVLGAACVPLAAGVAWWLHRNAVLYGDPTSLQFQKSLWYATAHRDFLAPAGIKNWLQTLYESGWARFGYFSIALGRWWYRLGYFIGLGGMLGSGWFLLRTWRSLTPRRRAVFIILGIAAVVHVGALFVYNLTFYQPQGRFLLPLLPLGALALSLSLSVLPPRLRFAGTIGLFLFLVLLDVQSIRVLALHS